MNKLFKLMLALSVMSIVVVPSAFAGDNLRTMDEIIFQRVANTNTPAKVTSVKASHILVKSQKQAQDLKSKIDNGTSFEELAKKYSQCPSGADGGDLGYFERGQMVPEFENAAFKLPVGAVSEPVQTQFGWHLIKVTGKK